MRKPRGRIRRFLQSNYVILFVVALVFGLAAGGTLGWLITDLHAKGRRASLEAQHKADLEKIEWTETTESHIRDIFEVLASKSLRANAADFAQRIQQLLGGHANQIGQVRASLETSITKLELHNKEQSEQFSARTNFQLTAHADRIGQIKTALETNIQQLAGYVRELEMRRVGAYQSLHQEIVNLEHAHRDLRSTTEQLVNALRSGPVRGRWGEVQLLKIIELSGMSKHVSFVEQEATETGRPDVIVHLPNEGRVTVDSKFPLVLCQT
jgi:DNA recombination protein RmuC